MDQILAKMTVGARDGKITAMPTAEQVAEALASIRGNATALEVAMARILAAAWYEFHTSGSYAIANKLCAAGLPSGIAAAANRVINRIATKKPSDAEKPKAAEALEFANENCAEIFAHETKRRKEQREKRLEAAKKRKEKAAAEHKAEVDAAREEGPEPIVIEYALIGATGQVEHITAAEFHELISYLGTIRADNAAMAAAGRKRNRDEAKADREMPKLVANA